MATFGFPCILKKLIAYFIAANFFIIAIGLQGCYMLESVDINMSVKLPWIIIPFVWTFLMLLVSTATWVSWAALLKCSTCLPATPPFVDLQTNLKTPLLAMYMPVWCSSWIGKHIAEIILYCYCFASCETPRTITLLISFAFCSCLCWVKIFTPRLLLVHTMKKASIFTSIAIFQNLIKKRFIEASFVCMTELVCIVLLFDTADNLYKALRLENETNRWRYNHDVEVRSCGCCRGEAHDGGPEVQMARGG